MFHLLHTFPVVLHVPPTSHVSSRAACSTYFTRFQSCYMLYLLHTFPVVLHVLFNSYTLRSTFLFTLRVLSTRYFPLHFIFLSASYFLRRATCSVNTMLLDLIILITLVKKMQILKHLLRSFFRLSVTSALISKYSPPQLLL
jgi:hypothetical protein